MTDQEHSHLAELMQDYLTERKLVRENFKDRPTTELEHLVATLSRKETRKTAGFYSTLALLATSPLIAMALGAAFPTTKESTDAFLIYGTLPLTLALAVTIRYVGNSLITTRSKRYVAQDLLEERKAHP